jgi:cob(I)alamin adenosyltransferase
MVVLNRIVTRTGDDGTSALATGERRAKSDVRFAAIGTIDELNAAVGVARLEIGDIQQQLARVQNDLFDLGADLATPETARRSTERLRVTSIQVARLEAEIDAFQERLSELKSFVLPGGTRAAAALHVCRTIARRAERTLVELAAKEALNPETLRYVNRLSDFFFVAARHANADGKSDVLWVPGQNR